MHREQLKQRTKDFALSVVRVLPRLPQSPEMRVFCGQLIRSASSVGANYRAACRGRSKAEFIAKLGVVIEEADESGYWLELIGELVGGETKLEVLRLQQEANELTAIFVAARKTSLARP